NAHGHGWPPYNRRGGISSDGDHSHEYDRERMKIWSSLAILFVIVLGGCAEGAKLVSESEDGGVVAYPFKGGQGAMLSSFRKDALALMKEKCGGPYTIVREGETKGRSRMAGSVEGAQEMVQERRWGIEFQCK
ncbi:MAG: hypothetical protein ACHQWV_06595, partial [Nitrospirales bacterium]